MKLQTSRTAAAALAGATALALTGSLASTASADSGKPAPTTTVDSCKATYKLNGAWNGRHTGFTSTLRFWNTGTAPISDWTLTFTFGGTRQTVTKLWSAAWEQDGATVTATPLAFNRTIQPGKQLTVGFIADGVNANPTSVTLSGTACGETASKGTVVPGLSVTLKQMIEGYAASGDLRDNLLHSLRNRAQQIARDEAHGNQKLEIYHLRAFRKQFTYSRGRTDVTPGASAALQNLARTMLTSTL
ncbi:cellulose binding domain-containing protein [Motilibacter peucedani]|uniref:Cellulose binding domain-containing protein n=1 Tax=Motilibacter peucedani TaxID=598650 RepID=A0A420XNE1_9ACTN|nr:cellulose binding domain-containing protein [Motilibacter peucedani]RKS72792.1 cellulose binding domain-containing protein [Motilibacter peucedani]